jgi:hypothetical protein
MVWTRGWALDRFESRAGSIEEAEMSVDPSGKMPPELVAKPRMPDEPT